MKHITNPLAAICGFIVVLGASPVVAQGVIDEIRVMGTYIPDEKRATSEIASVIDADDMSLAGDSDIAIALTRLPGLAPDPTGRFLVIRGLNERYTTTTLNGAQLPAPDPLKNAVPLDIFPTNVIGSVLVQKTFSAEYAGDFGGGLIEMRTKATPDDRFLSIEVSAGIDTESTGETGYDYGGSDTDWLGFDDGLRDLTFGKSLAGLSSAQLEAAGETLNSNMALKNLDIGADLGAKLNFGSATDTRLGRLGYVFAIDYSNKTRHRVGEEFTYTALDFTGRNLEALKSFSGAACRDLSIDTKLCGVQQTTNTVDLNLFASVDLELGDLSNINYTGILLRSSDKTVKARGGDTDSREFVRETRLDWTERQMFANIFSGQHTLGLIDAGEADIEWHAAFTTASRDVPKRVTYDYFYDSQSNTRNSLVLSDRSDGNQFSWNELEDDALDFGASIKQPIMAFERDIDIKAGFVYTDKQRDAEKVAFRFETSGLGSAGRQLLFNENIESIFSNGNISPSRFELRTETKASDKFDASFDNTQIFGQIDLQLSDFVRLSAGLRSESSQQTVNTTDRATLQPVNVVQDIDEVLPSATLTWEFAENMQLRFGASKTLNRPTSRELAPARFIREDGRIEQGNAELDYATLTNLDMRYEWYFDNSDSLTIGVFYKEIENPIEYSLNSIGGSLNLDTVNNGELAELSGIEAELDKSLFVRNDRDFFIRANGSYISSDVTRNASQFRNVTFLNGKLQGQSEYLANLQIGYEEMSGAESLNVVFNYVGERIYRLGTYGLPDLMEQPATTLNVVYRRNFEIGDNEVTLSAKATNILGEERTLDFGSFPAETYDAGTGLSVGLKWNL
ncbi:MAG: TonB-dependent receptor domain-containing protein [Parvibaculales bacterium]